MSNGKGQTANPPPPKANPAAGLGLSFVDPTPVADPRHQGFFDRSRDERLEELAQSVRPDNYQPAFNPGHTTLEGKKKPGYKTKIKFKLPKLEVDIIDIFLVYWRSGGDLVETAKVCHLDFAELKSFAQKWDWAAKKHALGIGHQPGPGELGRMQEIQRLNREKNALQAQTLRDTLSKLIYECLNCKAGVDERRLKTLTECMERIHLATYQAVGDPDHCGSANTRGARGGVIPTVAIHELNLLVQQLAANAPPAIDIPTVKDKAAAEVIEESGGPEAMLPAADHPLANIGLDFILPPAKPLPQPER